MNYRRFQFFIFLTLTLCVTVAVLEADYTIRNASATETAWAAYSIWRAADNTFPAGYRTKGWYEIDPGDSRNLAVPAGDAWVYIRVIGRGGRAVQPPDPATRDSYLFWMHPTKAFTAVEDDRGNFLKSDLNRRTLETAGFYAYQNGGSHTILNVEKPGAALARKVFNKHRKTFEREDIQSVLPSVFESLKDPKTQRFLNATTINLVVSNPNLLTQIVPDIDPKFVRLLKRDATLRSMLRDPQVQTLLQTPAAIDALAVLLRMGEPVLDVPPQRDPSARQNLTDLPEQQIYDQTIHSVVWIHTADSIGSGVLIDKRRQLVVTNQHVVGNVEWVNVFFPWRDQQDKLNKQPDFYINNRAWLERQGSATQAKVIAKNARTDLAIIQLVRIPTTAREIRHDLTRNVEDSMRRGDTVHIFGNPDQRLWNWTQGTFQEMYQVCDFEDGKSLVGCFAMAADTHPGNSGGPIVNGQGTLIGLVVGGTDETQSLAVPSRNIKALLNGVPANLGAISAPTYPKEVFRIRNRTGVDIRYQIKWSNSNDWKKHSLETGFILTHWSGGELVPQGYPQIRFDYIAGDESVTYRTYTLETARFRVGNNNHAPTYFFRYNLRGDRLDLVRDALASPTLSRAVVKQTQLLANYPNPFNPETWIPYELAEAGDVEIVISDVRGIVIRRLSIGHRSAGVYQSKSRAAYWDGKNEVGEPVASGVYFYTLTAGDFTATRKMLIRK